MLAPATAVVNVSRTLATGGNQGPRAARMNALDASAMRVAAPPSDHTDVFLERPAKPMNRDSSWARAVPYRVHR